MMATPRSSGLCLRCCKVHQSSSGWRLWESSARALPLVLTSPRPLGPTLSRSQFGSSTERGPGAVLERGGAQAVDPAVSRSMAPWVGEEHFDPVATHRFRVNGGLAS